MIEQEFHEILNLVKIDLHDKENNDNFRENVVEGNVNLDSISKG